MRKKFTMLLASMLACVGVMAQSVVTTINTSRSYTLECRSVAAHSTKRFIGVTDAGVIDGQSATPAYITFEAGTDDNSYYIKVGEKYLNCNSSYQLSASTEKSTAWVLGTVGQTVTFKYPGSTRYLNNNGTSADATVTGLQANDHGTNGPTAGNACSTWEMKEYNGASGTIEIAANAASTDTWTTATWTEVTENIPADVAAAESGQYSDATSSVWSASKKIALPAGALRATLSFGGGNNRLDILGVDLLDEDDQVVSSDYHFGYSGNAKVNNTYDLEVSAEGTYTIRYWVTFCAEANTSNGNITLQHYKLGVPVYSAADLSNDKVYTVTPADNATTGAWDVMSDGSRLSITAFSENAVDAASANQQFAFLTVNEEIYLYSYGAQKFVNNNGSEQVLTKDLSESCLVGFLASTIADHQPVYPLVVTVGGQQLHSTYQSHLSGQGGIITSWQHTDSKGNAVAIVPVDGTVDMSEAVTKIETYQIAREKAELSALIAEAQTIAAKEYINSTALTDAIDVAQDVADNESATYDDITGQIAALTDAINAAGYVTTVEGFSNNAIYTFVSNRAATAYMMYDGETDYVASQYMKTSLVGGENEANCQWAVYKSNNGYYYMYNLGAQKFMGTESAANTSIPFSATPQTTGLTFKVSAVATHPIMFSTDGGAGVANHSNSSFEGKNQAGLINWVGGFGATDDPGNVHKVAIVGELAEETLATIATAVATYEERAIAIQELGDYLDAFYANYYDVYGSGWRNQAGVNNYSQPEGDQPLDEAYEEVRTFYDGITDETAVADITAKKTYLEGLEANLTINQPEVGKFYRLHCVDGKKYLQSTTNTSNSRLTMSSETGSTSMFCYVDGGLLSYTAGLYADHRVFNTVGSKSTVTFSAAANGSIGCYNIKVGDSYHIYGSGSDLDSGNGTPDARNGYNWWLEEVTTLPVAVSAAGYATLYAPVALTIPADVTVYTATVNDEYLTLKEVEGTIPANTGVIIEAAEDTYDFNVAEDVEAIADNAFTGALAKSAKNAAKKVYTLQKPTDKEVGFYLFKGQNSEGVTTYINGFRAWVELDPATSVQALRITRGGTEDTTGIEQLVGNNAELVIYDLLGRRVEKMEKGIYIVNGKKVVIK